MEETELTNRSREARARLTQRLFPEGVPRLWCPTLTHFAAAGQFDEPRIRRHWQWLVPHVKGALDHIMAHGEAGLRREMPLLCSGVRLSHAWIERATALLRENRLMPKAEYME